MEIYPENKRFDIGGQSLHDLKTVRKWAAFLAVLGFIFLGLVIIMGIIAGTFLSAFSGGKSGTIFPESFLLGFLFIVAVIYFFHLLHLYQFSKNTSNALKTIEKHDFNKAMRSLKLSFVFLGILIITVITFYLIVLVLAGTSISFLQGPG